MQPKTANIAYILIFLTPFSLYSIPFIGDFHLYPTVVFLLLSLPFFVLTILKRGRIPNTGLLGVLYLLFWSVTIFGIFGAADQWSALKTAVVYALLFYSSFLYMMVFLPSRESVEKAVAVFLFVGILDALMGWVEFLGFYFSRALIYPPFAKFFALGLNTKPFGGFGGGSPGSWSIPGIMRMFGFHGLGSNIFGSYLLIPLGISSYMSHRNKKYRWLIYFLAATVLASFSRNAYLGMVVMWFFIYLFLKRDRFNAFASIFRTYSILTAVLLVMGLSYFTYHTGFFQTSQVRDNFGTHYNLLHLLERATPFASLSIKESSSLFSDYGEWAVYYCFSNLGFGQGGQNFDEFVYQRHPVEEWGSHSNFIGYLGDHGIWGFLTQIAIVMALVSYALKTYRSLQRRGIDDHLPLYLIAIYLGLVTTGIVRTFYVAEHTFMVAGLITKLYFLEKKPAAVLGRMK